MGVSCLGALVRFGVACGPGLATDPMNVACDAVSSCPNDPPPTQADVDECHTEAAGSCSGAYQSYRNCYASQRVCAYDGTTDVHATEETCGGEAKSVYVCVDGGLPPWFDGGADGGGE